MKLNQETYTHITHIHKRMYVMHVLKAERKMRKQRRKNNENQKPKFLRRKQKPTRKAFLRFAHHMKI